MKWNTNLISHVVVIYQQHIVGPIITVILNMVTSEDM